MPPAGPTTSSPRPAATPASEVELLRRMLVIREFEEEVQRCFEQGLVRASTHLATGQEAVSVGTCAALADGDSITCTYRGHAAVLAMGASPEAALAEIIGRATGLCGGKGGSMHLTDVERGVLGSFAIVGAHLPFAVGVALAHRHRREERVTACFFGDGATNIGAFHEALNLASLWSLPVLFVCENNLYGEYSALRSTTPVERLADRADAYAMAKRVVDGNDVLAVREAVAEARARALAGDGPTLLEALTYRHKGHSRSDPATYRPAEEVAAWLERDPITLAARRLEASGDLTPEAFHALREEVREEIATAAEAAKAAPPPPSTALHEDVL